MKEAYHVASQNIDQSPKRFKSKRYGTAVRNFGEHEFVRNLLGAGPRKSQPYTSIHCQEIEWNRTGTGTRYSLLLLCKSLPVPDSSQETRMNPAGGNRKHKTQMMQESSDSSADANAIITITVKHLNPLEKVFAPSGCMLTVVYRTCLLPSIHVNLEPIEVFGVSSRF